MNTYAARLDVCLKKLPAGIRTAAKMQLAPFFDATEEDAAQLVGKMMSYAKFIAGERDDAP